MDWIVTDASDEELESIQAQLPSSTFLYKNNETLPEWVGEAASSLYKTARDCVDRELKNDQIRVTIKIVIFASPQFNAWAGKIYETDSYYIALAVNSFPLLGNLVALLISGDTYTNVFNLQPNQSPLELRNVSSLTELSLSGPAPALDEVRTATAGYIGAKAVEFVILHELTHIIHGHVDLVVEMVGINAALSERANHSEYDRFKFRQTLEFDADLCGFRRLLRSSYDGFRLPPLTVMKSKFKWLHACPTAAVIVLSFLFDEIGVKPSSLWTRTHPIGAIRANYLAGKALDLLMSEYKDLQGVLEAILDLLFNVPLALNEVSGRDHRGMNFALAYKEIFESDFYKTINQSWSEVRPSLLKHKHVADLPGISSV